MSWTDRVVEYPNRVKLTAVSGQDNTFNMEAAEGTVYVEGTLLNAENLNNETMNLIDDSLSNGLFEELLWTNPNPSADFDAQTKALDLSEYNHVMITFAGPPLALIFEVGQPADNVFGLVSTAIRYRNVGVTGSGVNFGKGYYKTSFTGSEIPSNAIMRPQKIYGIRKK